MCIQLTRDFGSVNLRYVARANGATNPVVVVVIVTIINTVIIVVALRYGGRVIAITSLVQIIHTHGGSDARRHHWYVLQGRNNDCINFDK